MKKPLIEIIRNIILNETDIPAERVWIYNQNQKLPKDSGAFVILENRNPIVYANNNRIKANGEKLEEHQSINMQENIVICVCSKNTEASLKTPEIMMALSSTYSQQTEEKYGFHISNINQATELSFLEETAMLQRYDINIRCLTVYNKTRSIDYYDKYNVNIMYNQ